MTIKKHTISRDSNQGEQSFLGKLGHQGRKARTEMSLKGKHYTKREESLKFSSDCSRSSVGLFRTSFKFLSQLETIK